MTRDVSKQIAEAFAAYPADVEALAHRARSLVTETLQDSVEVLDSTRKIVGYCYGPGYAGTVCTLILSKKGVKIGIVRGADLPDPHGLMAGDGIYHRHVELRTPKDLEHRGLKPLLLTALVAWKERSKKTPVRAKKRATKENR